MKKHGHYCKVCGEYKANEKFSGKGHALISVILCFFAAGKTSGANDNKSLAKSPLAIIKGTNFLAEKPNGR